MSTTLGVLLSKTKLEDTPNIPPHQQQHQCRSARRRSGPHLVQNSQSAWASEIKTRIWNLCTKIWSRIWWRSKRPHILLYQRTTRLTRTMKKIHLLVLAIGRFSSSPINKDRLHREENCQKYDKAAFMCQAGE